MLSKEDIQLISQLLDEKMKPINERLNKMDERLDVIEDNTEVTRSVLNEVVKWIDVNFRDDYPFPTDTKEAI